MSIDDDIKALREKYPDLLQEFSDNDLAGEGFLLVPESELETYAKIKSDYRKLPKSVREEQRAIQRARATLEPSIYPAKEYKPPEEPSAPKPPKSAKVDYNINDYMPTPAFDLNTAQMFDKARETIKRAERGDKSIAASDIEAAQSILFNDRQGVNRSNFLMKEEDAEEILETPGFMSPLGILEPFDYPRGTSWAALAYLGEYLPDTDTWIGQQLQDAAGYAGGLTTDLTSAAPFFGAALPLVEDVGFGELAGRNLYEAASSGKLADAVTRFHGDGIVYVDTGYRLPNLTGPRVLDIVLPKEDMAKLRDKAKAQGATEAQIEMLDKLATSDTARTIAGIIPEFVVDPLIFAGPAKFGQVIQKGGKAIRVGSMLGEASQAVAKATGTKADDIMRLGVDVVDGNAEALSTFRDTVNKLEASVQAQNREADALIAASKASPENQVRAATEELTKQIEEVGSTAEPIRTMLTKSIEDAATPQAKEAAELALQVFDQKMVRVVDDLAKTRATLGMERDFAVNAEKYLKDRAKALRGVAARNNADAESIKRFITVAEEGGGTLGNQAVINRGLNFHIPLTQKQAGVSLPFFGKEKGIRLKPLQGDTAASISAWTGVNVPDLAKLNNTTVEGLEQMIRNGEKIVYQIGNKPSHMGKFAALSLLPEGVVTAYLRGLSPTPIAENLGNFQRYFSGNNYQRILELEKTQPLSAADTLSKILYEFPGRQITASVDKFMQLFATRFTQPLLASERLSKAMRYFENRDVKTVRNNLNSANNAILRLKTVAPDIWNAYQDATTKYLRAATADTDRINAFMARMMRQANEIAAARTAQGIETDGEQIMQEVMNAIESGQGQTLSKEELDIAGQITQAIKQVGDENNVEREAVRQSLLAMVRWVQSDPQTIADVIEEVRHLELLLAEMTKRGVEQTDENLAKLNEILTKIKASKPKKGTSEAASKKRLRELTRQAIKDIKEIQRRLKKGESIEDIEILQRQVEPVAKPEPAAVPEPEPAAVPEPEPAAVPEPEVAAVPEPATPQPKVLLRQDADEPFEEFIGRQLKVPEDELDPDAVFVYNNGRIQPSLRVSSDPSVAATEKRGRDILKARVKSPPKSWKDILKVLNEGGYINVYESGRAGTIQNDLYDKSGKFVRKITNVIKDQLDQAQLTRYDEIAEQTIINTDQYRKNFRKQTAYQKLFEFLDQGFVTKPGKTTWSIIDPSTSKQVGKIKNSLMQDLIDVNIIRDKGDETYELAEDYRKVAPEPAPAPEPTAAPTPAPDVPQAAIPEGFDLENLPPLTEDPALLKKLAKLPKSWQKAIDQLVEGGELIDDSLTRSKYVRVVRTNKSNEKLTKFDRTVSNITANTLKQLVDTGIIRRIGVDDYVLDPYNYFKSLLLRPKAKELVETLLDGGTLQSSKKIDDMFDTDLERALVGNTFVTGKLLEDGREVIAVVDNLGNEILTVPNDQFFDLLQKGRFATQDTVNPKYFGDGVDTPGIAGAILRQTKLDTTPILKSKTNNFKDLKLVDKAGKTVDLKTRKFVEELLNIGALKYLPEGNAGKGSFELAPDFMALRSRPAPEAPKQAAPPPAQPKAVEPEPAAPAPKAADEVVEVFDDTAQQAEILGAAKKGVLEIQDEILKLTEEIARRGDAPPPPKITPPKFKTPRGTSTSAMVRPLLNWEMDLFKQYRGIIDEANARRKAAGLEDMSEEAELRSMMAVFQDAPNALKRPEAFREATERYVTGTNPSNARLDVLPADKGQRFEELNQQIDEILVKTPAQRTADDKARLKALRAQQDALYFEQWQISGGFTPQFVGERFGALPEDIQDITESMSQMFQQYEKLYKEYGRDFTKDPFERMKLWGVVGYVPHMRKDFKNPIYDKSFERFSRGGLDEALSLTLDQAKERKIQGLIAEINALPKGNTEQNWTFSVDPNLLIAHFVSGAKSLNNQDYLVALLKGGVIRTFDNIDQAAREQYIPLFDRGEYARDMQILILGTRGDISTLINNKTGNAQEYINEFRKALGAAISNNRRIGEPETRPFKVWTDDIAEIRKTDTVEQALAGVNLHATIRNEDTFNAAERHKELVEAIMDERRTKLENLLVKKNELLDAASKDENIAKYTEQIAAIQLKLVETATDTQRARRKAERAAWEQVATEVNARVAKANNEREINLQVFAATGRLPNVSGKGLAMYMAKDQEMFRLYIPATVQESMSRTLEFTEVSGPLGFIKKASDSLNNFWKARITVLSLAFTARNWVGNLFSNALNVGVGGALDLSTNYKACLIGSLVDYHAKYGSIDNALFEMSKPENFKRAFLVDKGMDSQFMRLRERADLTALLRGLGVTDGKGLIDLGDNVMRPLDEILADLTNRGVISGQSTYRVDSDEIAYQYQKLAAEMGVKESTGKTINVKWSKAKTWLSGAEDTMYIGLPFIMGAPFVGMPKWLGQTIARRTENQGRMVNYIANLKQGRTSDEATEMVNKFLFDYSDLTNTQKTWMRTLFPFFTWNQKNILLHMELMQTNPTYYADMYRFFYGALPDISAAMEQDKAAAKGLDLADYDARNRAYEKIRTGPKYRAFRVAVDVDPTNNIVIQGFGLPIEGFAQNVGTANDIMNNTFKTFAALTPLGNSKGRTADIIDGLGAYGSQTNLALRAFIELGFDYDLFRQESITEGNYDYKQKYMLANDFGNLVQVLSQYSNPAVRPGEIETASTQGTGHLIAKYIIDQLDMVPVHNEKDGKMNWYVQNPEKIKALRAMRMLPYERLLREAATAIDLNQTMYMTPEVYESGRATNFLDNRNAKMYRFLSAYMGFKLKQDTDIFVQRDIFEENVKRLLLDYHSSMIPGAKK